MLCIWKYTCKFTSDTTGLLKGQKTCYPSSCLCHHLGLWSKLTVYWHFKNECEKNDFVTILPSSHSLGNTVVQVWYLLVHHNAFKLQLCVIFFLFSKKRKKKGNISPQRYQIHYKMHSVKVKLFYCHWGEIRCKLPNIKIYE